jgi:hypothetical protein
MLRWGRTRGEGWRTGRFSVVEALKPQGVREESARWRTTTGSRNVVTDSPWG